METPGHHRRMSEEVMRSEPCDDAAPREEESRGLAICVFSQVGREPSAILAASSSKLSSGQSRGILNLRLEKREYPWFLSCLFFSLASPRAVVQHFRDAENRSVKSRSTQTA